MRGPCLTGEGVMTLSGSQEWHHERCTPSAAATWYYAANGVSAAGSYNYRTFFLNRRARVPSDICPRLRAITSQDLGHVKSGGG
jgi:hypothetical protein